MAHCCVPQCSSDSRKKAGNTFHMIGLPKDVALRKQWIQKIRRDVGNTFEITRHTVVCSDHFKEEDYKRTLTGKRSLKNDVVPSVFSWNKPAQERRTLKRKLDEGKESETPVLTASTSVETEDCTAATICVLPDHDYLAPHQSVADLLKGAQDRIVQLDEKFSGLISQRHHLQRYSKDSDKIKFYTGFNSYQLLTDFFNYLQPFAVNMTSWSQAQRLRRGDSKCHRPGFNLQLPLIDQFFMFLNKIKLGTFNEELADKFNISSSTVSRIVLSWANFLYFVLGAIPVWPTRDAIDKHMPASFQLKYPKTRVILDCTEIFVQSPSSLNLNSELYSHYKGTTTFKGLIGITPGGLISFVSALCAGSISDKEITRRSGVLELLENGDEVMVDKGFLIQDYLTPIGCTLAIPPFLTSSRKQFSKQETERTQNIARLRVHVERAIRRVKEFHIFDGVIPLSLAGTVNQLWTICCLLTNFQGPLFQH